jgi:hypothetical protein
MNPDKQPVEGEERSLSNFSIFGKNNNNELLFAPTCTTCFNKNKYLSSSKKSVSINWLMSALIALESMFFFPWGCFIVDTTMINPTQFSYKCNYSVPQPSTPMSYDSHDPLWKEKAMILLKDIWTSPPYYNWEIISLITGTYTTVTPIINHAKTFLVVLWTDRVTGRFTRNISLKFHYTRSWWIPLKLCFLNFLLTWYGCYANQKKVRGFRGGTKNFCWVNESPRLLLLMLEVKRETMKRQPNHSTTMYLLR